MLADSEFCTRCQRPLLGPSSSERLPGEAIIVKVGLLFVCSSALSSNSLVAYFLENTFA